MIIKYWYRTENKAPAQIFLQKELDGRERVSVEDYIQSFFNPHYTLAKMVSVQELKHIEKSLYMLRIRTCGSFFRFPSVAEGQDELVLLDGFKKKTNKIDKRDIKRAKAMYQEYKSSK